MELEIYADVVCPWCYVGKARLDRALSGFGEVTVRVRPFQLDPHLPRAGNLCSAGSTTASAAWSGPVR